MTKHWPLGERAGSLIRLASAAARFSDTMQCYFEAQAAYRRAVIQLNAAVGKEVIQ